ncbi:hypothetical protein FTUN_1284 [Frigoriglobus tundricola]|uniref:Uncharacterized protein n=1 Tax=Frigoriglobus tundricola TaxID=2774151 RepID=A0A6M5YKG4_9BACT|nr:hypothetical protein FTUN_1284 [Frigoriglobus tundricola]
MGRPRGRPPAGDRRPCGNLTIVTCPIQTRIPISSRKVPAPTGDERFDD